MKYKRNMLIMVAVLAVLVISYGILNHWSTQKEETAKKKQEAEVIHVVDADDLTALSYNNGTNSMSLARDDNGWYDTEDKEIPLNQDTVEGIASAVTGLKAVRQLDDPDDLADYGLENTTTNVTFTPKDGKESVIHIGNSTGENYYATVDDAGAVYTIDGTFLNSLVYDVSQLVQNDSPPVVSSDILKKVEITAGGKTTTYDKQDDLDQLAGGIGSVALSELADYHVTDDRLKDYGLDDAGKTVVKVTYKDASDDKEKTFTFNVGKKDTDGTAQFVTLNDSKLVYKVTTEIVTNMTTVSKDE